MLKFLIVILFPLSISTGALALDLKLGQKVLVADTSSLTIDSQVASQSFATLIGARYLNHETIQLSFEVFYTGPDKLSARELQEDWEPQRFNILIAPGIDSLGDIQGITLVD